MTRWPGITRPILVVQPTSPMLADCAALGLVPAFGTAGDVRRWLAMTSLPFHVGVDTGMNRGGIWWEEFASAAPAFADAPGFEGLLTHFHSADRDPASVTEQWRRFQVALRALPKRPRLVHAANSAAALGHPEVAADLVRPGIFLYGGAVGRFTPQPVVTWRARVCRVARREAGSTVSYGATWRAEGPVWIATLAAGYADGLRRALSAGGAALLGGRRCKIVGAVTMDFTMVASETCPSSFAFANASSICPSPSINLLSSASLPERIRPSATVLRKTSAGTLRSFATIPRNLSYVFMTKLCT